MEFCPSCGQTLKKKTVAVYYKDQGNCWEYEMSFPTLEEAENFISVEIDLACQQTAEDEWDKDDPPWLCTREQWKIEHI